MPPSLGDANAVCTQRARQMVHIKLAASGGAHQEDQQRAPPPRPAQLHSFLPVASQGRLGIRRRHQEWLPPQALVRL